MAATCACVWTLSLSLLLRLSLRARPSVYVCASACAWAYPLAEHNVLVYVLQANTSIRVRAARAQPALTGHTLKATSTTRRAAHGVLLCVQSLSRHPPPAQHSSAYTVALHHRRGRGGGHGSARRERRGAAALSEDRAARSESTSGPPAEIGASIDLGRRRLCRRVALRSLRARAAARSLAERGAAAAASDGQTRARISAREPPGPCAGPSWPARRPWAPRRAPARKSEMRSRSPDLRRSKSLLRWRPYPKGCEIGSSRGASSRGATTFRCSRSASDYEAAPAAPAADEDAAPAAPEEPS